MELFSHRNGYREVRKEVQSNSFDKETINKLWDIISDCLISAGKEEYVDVGGKREKIEKINRCITTEVLGKPADTRSKMYPFFWKGSFLDEDSYERLRGFWFQASFPERVDTIEIFCKEMQDQELCRKFNETFKLLLVPYRVLNDGRIIDADSSEIEYQAIENAIEHSTHIDEAINLLFDRKNPNYLKAIGESVFAIEDECKQFGDKDFSVCLSIIEKKFGMHPAWKRMLKGLYGFSSDEEGIRHSGNTNSEVDFEEAKLVVVLSSSVVNYLREKRAKQSLSNNT